MKGIGEIIGINIGIKILNIELWLFSSDNVFRNMNSQDLPTQTGGCALHVPSDPHSTFLAPRSEKPGAQSKRTEAPTLFRVPVNSPLAGTLTAGQRISE